jgi:hypothetical protein
MGDQMIAVSDAGAFMHGTSELMNGRRECSISLSYTILVAIATLLIYRSLQAGARLLFKFVARRRSCISVSSQTEPWFQTQWFNFSVDTLKHHCIAKGLASHGLKADLVQRCVQHEQMCLP